MVQGSLRILRACPITFMEDNGTLAVHPSHDRLNHNPQSSWVACG